MRVALLAAVFVLAQAAVPAVAADDWQTFYDPTGMFSISVPQPMTASNDTTTIKDGTGIKVIVYDLPHAENDELMVRIADFTGQNLDPANAVQGALNGMGNAGYTIISQVPVSLEGHMGEDATLTDKDGLQYIDRVFFLENHLFQALTVNPKDATPDQSAMASRFSQSLHFRR
jgi:hypothetical protein